MSTPSYPSEGGAYLRDPVTGALTRLDDATVHTPPCQAAAPEPVGATDLAATAPPSDEE